MTARLLRANGLHHHAVIWGESNARGTVLLCHGFLDMALGFFKLAPLLAAGGYRVFSFDFRGHGESQWVGPGGYYHFADYVLDMHELVPQLTEAPFHLVGHSMGGTVATLYAALHLPQIRTLSLLEGYGPLAEAPSLATGRMAGWLSDMDALRSGENRAVLGSVEAAMERLARRNPTLAAADLRFLAEHSTEPHPRAPGLTWRFDPMHRTRSPQGFEPERFLAFARSIDRPTLIVQGEKGFRTGDDDARIAAYPQASRVELPGAGHMLHWTHADETARTILGFLSKLG